MKPAIFRKKLDPKAIQLIIVGYEFGKKAYRLCDPVKGSIIISRDVKFHEIKFPARKSNQNFESAAVSNHHHNELATIINPVSQELPNSNFSGVPHAPAPQTR